MNQANELLAALGTKKKHLPKISVIVVVRNEEDTIGRCLVHIRETALSYPTEIIVVDGGSTDKSILLAKSLADRVMESPMGSRSFQMDWGAKQATGDLLLFIRANTLLPRNWQSVLERCFFDSKVPLAAGSFHLGFERIDFPFDVIAGLANFRTHVTGIPQVNQSLFIRKEVYARSGGFPDVEAMEEYVFVPRLRQLGLGEVRVFSEKVTTLKRRHPEGGPIRVALKNSMIVLMHYLGIPPHKLARYHR